MLKPTVDPLQALRLPPESSCPRLCLIELLLQVLELLLEGEKAVLLALAGSLGCPAQLVQLDDLAFGDHGTEAAHDTDQGVGLLLAGAGLPGEVPAELGGMDRDSRSDLILRGGLLRKDPFQFPTIGQSFRPWIDTLPLRCAHQSPLEWDGTAQQEVVAWPCTVCVLLCNPFPGFLALSAMETVFSKMLVPDLGSGT